MKKFLWRTGIGFVIIWFTLLVLTLVGALIFLIFADIQGPFTIEISKLEFIVMSFLVIVLMISLLIRLIKELKEDFMIKHKLYKNLLLTDMERYVLKYDSLKDAFIDIFDEWKRCQRDLESTLESVIDIMIDSEKPLFNTELYQGINKRKDMLYKNMKELIANSGHYKALLEAKNED